MQGIIDIHCHILPGIDDGAQTVREAREMLKMQYRDGVRKIILTPHYRPGMFEPSVSQIYRTYYRLQEEAKETNIQLFLGREYHISSKFEEQAEQRSLPTMAGSSYVLAEFSGRHSYQLIRNAVEKILCTGYRPVIAHIERYPCLYEKNRAEELGEIGAYLQINAGSLFGENGREARRFCRQLMENDKIHFIASDAHNTKKRKPNLGKCSEFVLKKMGKDYARKIFCHNPFMVIKNSEIT